MDCNLDGTLFLFVPYIKTNVLSKLLDGIKGKIIIITTWNPRDIQFGSSELQLYPYCQEHGISLYVSKNLHLKVYSINLESTILATGNISNRGLNPNGNYEAGILIEHLTNDDRLYFEKIRNEARLVTDKMYEELKEWVDANKPEITEEIELEDIISDEDNFLISALPMTRSVDDLVTGYERISQGKDASDDCEVSACIFHDLTNYEIQSNLSESELLEELSAKFFAHPFIEKIDELISPEAYFGRIKEWVQDNCTDVPVPSRRELTGNVQVLLEWFEKLGNDKYKIDIPGARSQRIYKSNV